MWTVTEYEGVEYHVPETGRNHNLNAVLTEIPDDNHARAFLMQDGNLGVPGGRYGNDTRSCMEIAILIDRAHAYCSGDPMTYHSLEHAMGMVVNSSDDVLITLIDDVGAMGEDYDPRKYLDEDQMREAIDVMRHAYDDETADTLAKHYNVVDAACEGCVDEAGPCAECEDEHEGLRIINEDGPGPTIVMPGDE